jgi:hypothetical protein
MAKSSTLTCSRLWHRRIASKKSRLGVFCSEAPLYLPPPLPYPRQQMHMCNPPPPPPSPSDCLSCVPSYPSSFGTIVPVLSRSSPRTTQVYNNGVPNMDDLATLHEASILDNIELRFRMDRIYTNSGPILIAMNPFKWLPIYGENVIKSVVSPNPLLTLTRTPTPILQPEPQPEP